MLLGRFACLLLVFVGCLLVKVVVLKGNSWLWNLLLKLRYPVNNFYWKLDDGAFLGLMSRILIALQSGALFSYDEWSLEGLLLYVSKEEPKFFVTNPRGFVMGNICQGKKNLVEGVWSILGSRLLVCV